MIGRHALLAASALWLLSPAQARAQAAVACVNCTSELAEILREGKRAVEVGKHIVETARAANGAWQTVRAVSQVRDLGSAMTALNMLGIQNPLPVDVSAVQQLLSGYGGPLDKLDAATRVYLPIADDWPSARLNMAASQIDGRRQIAALNYDTAAQRQQRLAAVRARAATASDPKEVWDLHLASTLVVADTLSQAQAQQAARDMAEAGRLQLEQTDEEWQRGCMVVMARYYRGETASATCPKPAAQLRRIAFSTGAGGATGYAGGGSSGGGAAMDAMLAQSWGGQAADNARSLGVNPGSLAGVGYKESGMNASARASTGTAGGAFQFIDDTWREQAAKVGVSTDPSAKFDGATASLPAANYLREAGIALQERGVAAPTTEQAYGIYQFGPQGASLALADPSTPLSVALPRVSSATFAANGLSGATTVGDYFAKNRSKFGGAAAEPVFLPSNT